jgi:hypothetical protein
MHLDLPLIEGPKRELDGAASTLEEMLAHEVDQRDLDARCVEKMGDGLVEGFAKGEPRDSGPGLVRGFDHAGKIAGDYRR